mgnify:CR=1 FL=1
MGILFIVQVLRIYIGNNKMIHASEPGIGVVITDLDARGYNYNKRYVTARRIVE